VTADERHAALYSCKKTAGAVWHLDPLKTLENRWENYHERHRPSALGRGPTANAAQHFASLGHEVEEEHRRFARDVRDWLRLAIRALHVGRVSVFAAPHFLGLLREQLADMSGQADFHEAELTRLGAAELAGHQAIMNALDSPIGDARPER
jgi:hypothetical protein